MRRFFPSCFPRFPFRASQSSTSTSAHSTTTIHHLTDIIWWKSTTTGQLCVWLIKSVTSLVFSTILYCILLIISRWISWIKLEPIRCEWQLLKVILCLKQNCVALWCNCYGGWLMASGLGVQISEMSFLILNSFIICIITPIGWIFKFKRRKIQMILYQLTDLLTDLMGKI